MLSLNLPSYEIKIAERNGKNVIFDMLRKRYVALTPEEWVRQHFVHYLTDYKGYPKGLLANEIQLDLNGTKKRCDTVLYNKDLSAKLIVEYKAPHIEITQTVFDQITRYDFENREFKIEIEEQSFYQLHEAVLQAVNQTNYERYLMIVRSAGIVRRSLIRSQNVLNFGYALFLALRERKVENSKIEQIVRRWLALSILTGRYSASPESSFDYDIKRFFSYDDPMEYLRITEAGELSDAYWSVNLVQRLNTSVASSPYFNLFLIAQVKAHDKGFLSTQIDVETMLENRGDIHHLFPKKYLIQHGIPQAQYNQIANYAFIQQEINIKIRDNAPSVYMREVFHQCETKQPVYGGIVEASALRENLRQNCIPDGFEDLEIHDYQQFLAQRRVLMAEKIHQYYDAL